MTPQLITIETAAPRGKFAGAVAQAYFIVEDTGEAAAGARVVLTDCDGNRLHDGDGSDYVRTLGAGDTAKQVAGRLLRSFRTKFRGDRARGFDRPLDYSSLNFKY